MSKLSLLGCLLFDNGLLLQTRSPNFCLQKDAQSEKASIQMIRGKNPHCLFSWKCVVFHFGIHLIHADTLVQQSRVGGGGRKERVRWETRHQVSEGCFTARKETHIFPLLYSVPLSLCTTMLLRGNLVGKSATHLQAQNRSIPESVLDQTILAPHRMSRHLLSSPAPRSFLHGVAFIVTVSDSSVLIVFSFSQPSALVP